LDRRGYSPNILWTGGGRAPEGTAPILEGVHTQYPLDKRRVQSQYPLDRRRVQPQYPLDRSGYSPRGYSPNILRTGRGTAPIPFGQEAS